MAKKIIILLKKNLHIEEKVIENIKKFLDSNDARVIVFNELKKADLADADLVITLGGDGTFVKAANLIEDSLILGINAEPHKSEGALTSVTVDEIDKLKNLNEGRFEVIKRYRARVKLNGRMLDEHVLNEVYVGAASQFHSSRYKIKFGNKEEEQRSSGIIVSTGTGSKAWFLSAGGRPFHHADKKLHFIVREPYFGERIFIPTLLTGEILEGERLEIESKRDFGGIVAINDSVYDFNIGDIVEIELSDKPLRVIKLK